MSAELTYSIAVHYSKNNNEFTAPGYEIVVDAAGDDLLQATMTLSTTWESLPLGDVAVGGLCWLKNVGADDICIREDLTGSPRIRLKPGEEQLVRFDPVGFGSPAAKAANTASTLKFTIFDD